MPVQIAGIFYFLLIHNSDALQDFLDALEQLLRSKSTTMDTFYRKIDKLVEENLPPLKVEKTNESFVYKIY